MRKINIAIDGPSGAGKSSIADQAALDLDMHHLDTGGMYRAVAYILDQQGILPEESDQLKEFLQNLSMSLSKDQIIVNGKRVDPFIRSERVSKLSSDYAKLPSVRKKLVELQREIAKPGGFILDGRDICDVVLPDAELKIYLDASVEQRARRRWLQSQASGSDESLESIFKKIENRDKNDRSREVSPLRRSEQAIYLDTSNLSFEQSVEELKKLALAAIQGDLK